MTGWQRSSMPTIPGQDWGREEPTVRNFIKKPNDEKPTIFSKIFGKMSSTKNAYKCKLCVLDEGLISFLLEEGDCVLFTAASPVPRPVSDYSKIKSWVQILSQSLNIVPDIEKVTSIQYHFII